MLKIANIFKGNTHPIFLHIKSQNYEYKKSDLISKFWWLPGILFKKIEIFEKYVKQKLTSEEIP